MDTESLLVADDDDDGKILPYGLNQFNKQAAIAEHRFCIVRVPSNRRTLLQLSITFRGALAHVKRFHAHAHGTGMKEKLKKKGARWGRRRKRERESPEHTSRNDNVIAKISFSQTSKTCQTSIFITFPGYYSSNPIRIANRLCNYYCCSNTIPVWHKHTLDHGRRCTFAEL